MIDKRQWLTCSSHTLREAAWAPLSVFSFYLVGLALGFYKLFPPLDIPTHFMGGVVITYFYRAAIRHSQRLVGEIPLPIQVLLAVTGADGIPVGYVSLVLVYAGLVAAVAWILRRLAGAPVDVEVRE